MSNDSSVESLFKEHSFEEIESVRDNLANEIEKRTELLKSIVKEKYRDIVETSGAIQSMKVNLTSVEKSLWTLDSSIAEFYNRVNQPPIESARISKVHASTQPSGDSKTALNHVTSIDGGASNNAGGNTPSNTSDKERETNQIKQQLFDNLAELWDSFDAGDLETSVRLYNETTELLNAKREQLAEEQKSVVDNIETTLNRTKGMMKNFVWHKIQTAGPEQVGIIAGCEADELFHLGLDSSIEFLVDKFRHDISDNSFQAQILRYQTPSYFNSQSNDIDTTITDDIKGLAPIHVQIPKHVSPELSTFLYNACRVINTIAGFNLNRRSIIESLATCIEKLLLVYEDLQGSINALRPDSKRKRSLQLYFDLLYLRVFLNTSKSLELIEKLDPKIVELANNYELMIDSIELYMISAALHANVMQLSQSTVRLFGLLIPHLQ